MEILIDWLNWLLGPESSPTPTHQSSSGVLSGPPEPPPGSTHLWPRWIFLRALGLIYFSAFYSLIFQIKGLIGPDGLLPASEYLTAVAHYFGGAQRFWFVPTVLWIRSGDRALETICWIGLVASLLLIVNAWPR